MIELEKMGNFWTIKSIGMHPKEVEYNLDLLALLWWSPDYEDQSYEMRIAHYKHIDDLIKRLKITGKN